MVKIILFSAYLALSTSYRQLAADPLSDGQINTLREIGKGFTDIQSAVLDDFLKSKRLIYVPEVVPKNVLNKQVKNNYKSFHDKYSTYLARKFKKRWRTRLAKAEKKYGVSKEAIVAIILVETGLGRIKGRYNVPSVFTTIILSSESQINDLATEDQKRLNKDVNYKKKLARKKEWAKNEWHTLLKISQKKMLDVLSVFGSSSGAFGVCQFLPSSYLKYAVDGDGDKKIRLDRFADAIPSVGHYLQKHGWGVSEKAKRKAVFAYNHSEIYVDTILKVAKTIR
ncbi:lytic murein transglycosylase [Oligoflexaceae bacterium]|nr:lytic murein transglycosylase [Oligoflexaceae bacterium]